MGSIVSVAWGKKIDHVSTESVIVYCDGLTQLPQNDIVIISISDALGSVLLLNEKHEDWRPYQLGHLKK